MSRTWPAACCNQPAPGLADTALLLCRPAAPAIQAMPVTSQICEPAVGAVIDDDEVTGESIWLI